MSDGKPKLASLEKILDSWRSSIGPEVFDKATPGQSLRPKSSAHRPADQTMEQTSAPSSNMTPPRESLSNWHEYRLGKQVAQGGMGQIFSADQGSLIRDVAIKRIIPERLDADDAAAAENAKASFVAEALVTGYLDHPNIVPVYSLGQDDTGAWFFSMKMVGGTAWKYLLHPDTCVDDEDRIIPEKRDKAAAMNLGIDTAETRAAHLDENLKILQAVCNAVAFAHSKHIIHRDLKPENVMVGAFGEVLVMDWGMAVDVSETVGMETRVPHKSLATGMAGTASYMAPEQVESDGNGLSTRTDVFLLGAMLHELLTGQAPNNAESLNGALAQAFMCDETVLKFENVPQELADICRNAMRKDPVQRFASVMEFQNALSEFLKHRESAIIVNKADQEAKVQAIPNLTRAVVLYDQALELWPENADAKAAVAKTRNMLAMKERAVRRTRMAAMGLAAAVFLTVTIAFFWIRSEQAKSLAALQNEKNALQLKLVAERDRADALKAKEEAWLEKDCAQDEQLKVKDLVAKQLAKASLGIEYLRAKNADMENAINEIKINIELDSLEDVHVSPCIFYIADSVLTYRKEFLRRLCIRNGCTVSDAMSPKVKILVTAQGLTDLDRVVERAASKTGNVNLKQEDKDLLSTLKALEAAKKYHVDVKSEDEIEEFFVQRKRKQEIVAAKVKKNGQDTFLITGQSNEEMADALIHFIEDHGGVVAKNIDAKVDYVVVTRLTDETLLQKIKKLGLKTIGVTEVSKFLR